MISKDLIEKIEKELYVDEINDEKCLEYEDIDEILVKNLGENIEWEFVEDSEDCDFDFGGNLEELSRKVNERLNDEGCYVENVLMLNGGGISSGCDYGDEFVFKILVYVFNK